MRRIPDGQDDLYRQDCAQCGRLLFRFARALVGGPVEIQCRVCKHVSSILFSSPDRPELPDA